MARERGRREREREKETNHPVADKFIRRWKDAANSNLRMGRGTYNSRAIVLISAGIRETHTHTALQCTRYLHKHHTLASVRNRFENGHQTGWNAVRAGGPAKKIKTTDSPPSPHTTLAQSAVGIGIQFFFFSLSLSVSIFVPFSLRFLRSAKNQRMPTTRQPPPGSFGECGWSLYLWFLVGNQQNINNHSSSTISHRLSMMSLSFSTAHNTARPQFMHYCTRADPNEAV